MKLIIEGTPVDVTHGSTFAEIITPYQEANNHNIVLVVENGKIKELNKRAKNENSNISFILRSDTIGYKTYERSALMLLVKSVGDVLGSEVLGNFKIEFVIGRGCYCSVNNQYSLKEKDIESVKKRMLELVKKKIVFHKEAYTMDDAMKIFKKQKMEDKLKLFKYRRSSYVNIYELDGYFDYYYGYMLPNTSYIKQFDLIPYEQGMMLVLPERNAAFELNKFNPKEKLFQTLSTTTKWAEEMEISTVGDLNDKICSGGFSDIILVQEALQERRISEIASEIASRKDVKFIMIAGPSSSGKTSFSHRLSIQLQTYGLKPHPIAVDDYFINRDSTPLDEFGNLNFECLEAIDTKQFNQDMSLLLEGKEVEMPHYNFKIGEREYLGDYKKLGKDDILVIEGIHALNDKMSFALPDESKFKIYISALSCLNVDKHNRIPTTDGRLLRRMVRDARTRGITAQRTLDMWPSVRRGEEQNIFPYQESADVMFNSSLIYELAVLKVYAEPLLFGISKGEPGYFEAKRLLKFLGYFLGVSADFLPNNSIVREFVGGSCFHA
ncbi:MAG: nucleoside kinase [Lachnospiraceae bacterium]